MTSEYLLKGIRVTVFNRGEISFIFEIQQTFIFVYLGTGGDSVLNIWGHYSFVMSKWGHKPKKVGNHCSMLRPPLRPPIGYLAVIDSDGAMVMELSSHIYNANSVLLRHFGNI